VAGVAGLALAAAIPGGALAKTAALPATGDWEATGAGGTTASFEVAIAGRSGHAKYRVVEDFAVDAPITCTNSSEPAIPFDVEVVDGPLRLAKDGTFSSGAIRDGAGTLVSGRFSGTHFTIAYRHESSTANQFAGGTEVCDTGTIHITAAPGHRQQVKDGIWQGVTQTNEPVVFYVAAGGRALVAPPSPPTNGSPQAAFAFGQFTQTCSQGGCSPSSNDICAYESPTSLFVAADGSFDNSQWDNGGDNPTVAGTFSGASRASGQFANGPQGCGQTDWSAAAG
jgi:hypothetical protein